MSLAEIRLDDKYRLETGHLYLTGTQALTRLPMLQKQRDKAHGLNTACFISGYRGSPLGNLDKSLWEAKSFLKDNHIHFQPGVNEELAATAVWGSQQTSLFPGARYDGVFAMWYGKGPGVDRCGDVFKHGNSAGVSAHGGVLLLAGDDHGCKSSSIANQSEHAFIAADRFTIADIVAAVGLDFARLVRYRPPAEFENLHRWFDACRERPAAKAGV